MPKYLITGGAGFIGSHLVDRLSLTEAELAVIDNFDACYSRDEKLANISPHILSGRVALLEADILDDSAFDSICLEGFDAIVHLAALAGVRPSLARPLAYQQVNVVGTTRLLELAKQWSIPRFIFASSSSVYGNHPAVPWTESLQDLLPISPYAASKLSAELIGRTYSHLYGIAFVALRLFTVYGPRQRPDLAVRQFAELIMKDQPISMYGDGESGRDYTYVDDVIDGIIAALTVDLQDSAIYNLGNGRPLLLRQMIDALEIALHRKAAISRRSERRGDVAQTFANIERARADLLYNPKVTFADGLQRFVVWLHGRDNRIPSPRSLAEIR
jgi:UDP-glucuronate 4-epimerase